MLHLLKQFISRHFVFPTAELPLRTSLSGQVFIVTGGSRGIGQAIVETLSSRGAHVVVVARDVTAASPSKQVPGAGERLAVSADVTQEGDVERVVKLTLERFGRLDGLINNAGINTFSLLEETALSDFDQVLAVNVRAAFLMARAVIPHFKREHRGLIVNIGSKISHNTQVGSGKTVYALTKYALEGLSFALNRELKPWGIRVTCLMPGTVNTFASLDAKHYLSPYQVAEVVALMAELGEIDFESIVFKSKAQDNI